MIVWQTQVKGLCGPCCWRNLEDAITELRELAEEIKDDLGSFTITAVEMTEEEFDNLPEFAGY